MTCDVQRRQVVDKTDVSRMFPSKDLEEMFRLDLSDDAEHPKINHSAYRAIKADKVISQNISFGRSTSPQDRQLIVYYH